MKPGLFEFPGAQKPPAAQSIPINIGILAHVEPSGRIKIDKLSAPYTTQLEKDMSVLALAQAIQQIVILKPAGETAGGIQISTSEQTKALAG